MHIQNGFNDLNGYLCLTNGHTYILLYYFCVCIPYIKLKHDVIVQRLDSSHCLHNMKTKRRQSAVCFSGTTKRHGAPNAVQQIVQIVPS